MHRRTALAVTTGVLAFGLVSGCSGSSKPPSATTTGSVVPPSPSITPTPTPSDDPVTDIGFPPTVGARPTGHDYVALPVPSADLSSLVNIHGGLLAALVDHGAFAGEVYPAISDNDGASWTIRGPQFDDSETCQKCTTNHLVVSHDRTLVAWGRGGRYIHATRDQGKHWYTATFPSAVIELHASGRRLYARVLGNETAAGKFPTRQYVSTDDAHTWHRGGALGPVTH